MTTRRHFLLGSLAVLAGAGSGALGRSRSQRRKLRLGAIGVGNRGRLNLGQLRDEEITALCDVDAGFLDVARAEVAPAARLYRDYREMLEKEELDAVVVSAPDHHHAPATSLALRRGLHVYCEKPFTHSLHEVRPLIELARSAKAVTQIGTQIHAHPNYHRVVEAIRAGAVGRPESVHVFCEKSWSAKARPSGEAPVPEQLAFDLWLGPAPEQPYHTQLHPEEWRRWWDFGGGTLADMGCHLLDLALWALDLGTPRTVTAEGPPADPHAAPERLHVRWEYPRAGGEPIQVHWYDGGWRPEELLAERGLSEWKNGVLFVGTTGYLISDYERHVIGPEQHARGFTPPVPWIPRSTGHVKDWLDAIRSGGRTACNFEDGSRLAEAVLLGTVAHRVGKSFTWDGEQGRILDCPEAERFCRYDYRAGWTL
jgi:predicted dehydrogenase